MISFTGNRCIPDYSTGGNPSQLLAHTSVVTFNNFRRRIVLCTESNGWLPFFDILLMASSHVKLKEKNIQLPVLPRKLIFAHAPAYMDHQITLSATLESLQKKGNIISAYCIMFRVDIPIHNLK